MMEKCEFQVINQDRGEKKTGWIETSDGALIYVETAGSGPPVLLIHGWTMSGRLWYQQMAGLSGRFQVVNMDLRGHGNSSKTLDGHTLSVYAADIYRVIIGLNLKNVVLVGWSLAGPVVLEYWRQYGAQKISALVLVETAPFPFSNEKWNTHSLKGYNFKKMHASLRIMQEDRVAFGENFVHSMFESGKAPSEVLPWMLDEHLKTPTSVAMAIYSDYAMRDYTGVLKDVSIPSLAVFGNSNHLCFGPRTGGYVAAQIPHCRLEVLKKSGHMPFYEEAEAFNHILAEFVFGTR